MVSFWLGVAFGYILGTVACWILLMPKNGGDDNDGADL